MSTKLKVFGLGLFASLAFSAVAVIPASAETGGHFTAGAEHVILKGGDDEGVGTTFTAFGQEVECSHSTYEGTINDEDTTVTDVTITPTYTDCEVTSLGFDATVDMTGCDYLFTIRGDEPDKKDNTVHLECPNEQGPKITVEGTFGHCTIEVTANQTPAGGVVYTTGIRLEKHDITVDVTASAIHAVITEGGFFQCGTSSTTTNTAELGGLATVWGEDSAGNPVDITATGAEA